MENITKVKKLLYSKVILNVDSEDLNEDEKNSVNMLIINEDINKKLLETYGENNIEQETIIENKDYVRYVYTINNHQNLNIKLIVKTLNRPESELLKGTITIQIVIDTIEEIIDENKVKNILSELKVQADKLDDSVYYIKYISSSSKYYHAKNVYTDLVKENDYTFKTKSTYIRPSTYLYISLNNDENDGIQGFVDKNVTLISKLVKVGFNDENLNFESIEGNIVYDKFLMLKKDVYVKDKTLNNQKDEDIIKILQSQCILIDINDENTSDQIAYRINILCKNEFNALKEAFDVSYPENSKDNIRNDNYMIRRIRALTNKGDYLITNYIELDIFNRMQSILERMSMRKFHLINNLDGSSYKTNEKILDIERYWLMGMSPVKIKINNIQIPVLKLKTLDFNIVNNLENQFKRITNELDNFNKYIDPSIKRRKLEIDQSLEKSNALLSGGIYLIGLLSLIPIIFGGMSVGDTAKNNPIYETMKIFFKDFNENYLITIQSSIGIFITLLIILGIILKIFKNKTKDLYNYKENIAIYKIQEMHYCLISLNKQLDVENVDKDKLIKEHDNKLQEMFEVLCLVNLRNYKLPSTIRDSLEIYSTQKHDKSLLEYNELIKIKEIKRKKLIDNIDSNSFLKKINLHKIQKLEKAIFYNRTKIIEIDKLNELIKLEIVYNLYDLERLYQSSLKNGYLNNVYKESMQRGYEKTATIISIIVLTDNIEKLYNNS